MQSDRDRARAGRNAALVMAGSGLATIFAPWIVRVLGLPVRYEFLIYLASLAGFAWALWVTWRIWRSGKD